MNKFHKRKKDDEGRDELMQKFDKLIECLKPIKERKTYLDIHKEDLMEEINKMYQDFIKDFPDPYLIDPIGPSERLKCTTKRNFKVNDFIELKLEGGRTNIYVAGELFDQCMYILININKNKLKKYESIESIDDATAIYNEDIKNERDFIRYNITPEVEFQAHCSNIQAWVDNDYDTRILHSNLAFPFLRKLVDVGDQKAKDVFQKEIIDRFYQGNQTVITFLIEERYLDYLEIDQIIEVVKISLMKTGKFNADIDLKRIELEKDKKFPRKIYY